MIAAAIFAFLGLITTAGLLALGVGAIAGISGAVVWLIDFALSRR